LTFEDGLAFHNYTKVVSNSILGHKPSLSTYKNNNNNNKIIIIIKKSIQVLATGYIHPKYVTFREDVIGFLHMRNLSTTLFVLITTFFFFFFFICKSLFKMRVIFFNYHVISVVQQFTQ
jgi:hypothetical protein